MNSGWGVHCKGIICHTPSAAFTDSPYKVLIGYIILQNGRKLCYSVSQTRPLGVRSVRLHGMPLPHSCATVFAHFGLFFALCYPIEPFHPISRTRVSPEWTHYSHSSPVRRGLYRFTCRTIAVFTHTIQFGCIIFDNSMYFVTLHTFYLYTQVMDLQRIKRKFAKFSSLMESRDFTFHTYCQKQLSTNMSKFSCKFLRSSGANPFLKSYTTILQWSVDGYNTICKKFLR